jgi:Flp pilus assembly protein TadB
MNTISLRDKARRVLARRQLEAGVGMYLRQNAARHLFFSAIFWLLIILLWAIGQHAAAFVIAGFWAGRLVRDIQWYRQLAAEWDTTRELLDWQKVEALAGSP